MKFIFDVDGTITPSRKRISEDFLPFFTEFVENNDVIWLLVVIGTRH